MPHYAVAAALGPRGSFASAIRDFRVEFGGPQGLSGMGFPSGYRVGSWAGYTDVPTGAGVDVSCETHVAWRKPGEGAVLSSAYLDMIMGRSPGD